MGAQGYLRRLTRRLTEDPEQRDSEELSDEVANTGAQRAIDCERGQEVTMVGTLRSVERTARAAPAGSAPNCSTAATPSRWCGWGNAASPASTRAVRCGCGAGWASWRTEPRPFTTRTTKFSGDHPGSDPRRTRLTANRVSPERLLAQVGGVSGLIYSSLPVVTFVAASSVSGLLPAIGARWGWPHWSWYGG